MMTTVRTETGFGAVFLANNPSLIALALKTAVEAAVGALKIFHLIYPERFKIMDVDRDANALVGWLNTVFSRTDRTGRRRAEACCRPGADRPRLSSPAVIRAASISGPPAYTGG
jgi:hypothetical protein